MPRALRFAMLTTVLIACCAATLDGGVYRYRNVVDVGDFTAIALIPAEIEFQRLAQTEHEITIRIDSAGGVVIYGMRFARDLEDLKKRKGITVTCIVDGLAASMGANILQFSLCDTRLGTKRSTFLFHHARMSSAPVSVEQDGLTRAFDLAMGRIVADRLHITVEDLFAKMGNDDWVLTADEALAAGVIDAIVDPSDVAPPEN